MITSDARASDVSGRPSAVAPGRLGATLRTKLKVETQFKILAGLSGSD